MSCLQSSRSGSDKRNTWTSHSVLPPILSPRTSDSATSRGSNQSGPVYLPNEPITLRKSEEMELMKNIGVSLQNHSMDILKTIYNEVSAAYDQGLSGWAQLSDVAYILQKCQVLLPANII